MGFWSRILGGWFAIHRNTIRSFAGSRLLAMGLVVFTPVLIDAQQRDTLSSVQFLNGCAAYRGLVMEQIINTLVDFNLLCDSLRDASPNPDAHELFRQELMHRMLTIEGWDPEHIVSTSIPRPLSAEKGVERRYKQWAYQNRVNMFEFTFLINMGIIEEKSPYKLGNLRSFFKEVHTYDLHSGQTFVDVGAGSGVVSYILRLTGLPLQMYMTEIDQQFLAFHQHQVSMTPFNQTGKEINIVVGGSASLGLAGNLKADRILMREVYHHLSRSSDVLEDVHHHLKEGGRLILVESVDDLCPDRKERCNKSMKLSVIKEQLTAAGFILVGQEQVDLSYVLLYESTRRD